MCSLIFDHSPLFYLVLVEMVAKQQGSSEKIAFQLRLQGSNTQKKRETNIAEGRDFVCTNSDEKCSSGVSAFHSLLTVSGDGVLYTGSSDFWAVSTVCGIKRTHFESRIWFCPQAKWWGGTCWVVCQNFQVSGSANIIMYQCFSLVGAI